MSGPLIILIVVIGLAFLALIAWTLTAGSRNPSPLDDEPLDEERRQTRDSTGPYPHSGRTADEIANNDTPEARNPADPTQRRSANHNPE